MDENIVKYQKKSLKRILNIKTKANSEVELIKDINKNHNILNTITNKSFKNDKIMKLKKNIDEMTIVNNLNDKLIEDNGKMKEEILNMTSDIEKNKQQNQELNKTKDKYYKLLDDYKQLTSDCNILRDEKTLVQLEQKQLKHELKMLQDENEKLKNENSILKSAYDKKNDNPEIIPKPIIKKVENKTIEIYEDKNDIKQEENPTAKSLVIENSKRMNFNEDDENKINDINNVISDVNNNINDLMNKINFSDKKEQKESNVTFNISEINKDEQEKNSNDEEQKNLRMSKVMQRIKKNQEKNEKNSQLKLNKSLKVQDLAKQLENNLQKKTDNEKKEDNGSTEVKIENGANVVNILENQQLTKSIKKKKKAKQFAEEENE